MKKLVLLSFLLALACNSFAQSDNNEKFDLNSRSEQQSKNNREEHLKKIWEKQSFVNFSYNSTNLKSTDLPTLGGTYSDKFENSWGIGFQYGNSYNFSKKPIASIMFIGIDFSPINLNYNQFKKKQPSTLYTKGNSEPFNMPWHTKKQLIDYGISLGPSLTLYPFTPIQMKATDNIRLHLYFHVGYNIGLALVNGDDSIDDDELKKLWGHGLSTCFGFNLTWNGIGLGYESVNFSDFRYETFNNEYDTGRTKTDKTTNRIYLQYIF